MMHGPKSSEEARLKQLMLADLAYIHGIPIEELEEEYESMYAFDWNHNALSMGKSFPMFDIVSLIVSVLQVRLAFLDRVNSATSIRPSHGPPRRDKCTLLARPSVPRMGKNLTLLGKV